MTMSCHFPISGRVVCKTCLRCKIENVRICIECFQLNGDNEADRILNQKYVTNIMAPSHSNFSSDATNQMDSPKSMAIKTQNLYEQGMRHIERERSKTNNPYLPSLTAHALSQHNQANAPLPALHTLNVKPSTLNAERSGISMVSTTSTVPIPVSLLDRTTNAPLPTADEPVQRIPSPLARAALAEEDEPEDSLDEMEHITNHIGDHRENDEMRNQRHSLSGSRPSQHSRHSGPSEHSRQSQRRSFRQRKPKGMHHKRSANSIDDVDLSQLQPEPISMVSTTEPSTTSTTSSRRDRKRRNGISPIHSIDPKELNAFNDSLTANDGDTALNKALNGDFAPISGRRYSANTVSRIKWLEDSEGVFAVNGSKMKLYEDQTDLLSQIKKSEPMILRLDGYSFGLFTDKMEKPFDDRFHSAMVNTACDLLKELEPFTALVHSDEILLIFPSTHSKAKGGYLFGGKVTKILSIVCSMASVRLMYHLRRMEWTECDKSTDSLHRNGSQSVSSPSMAMRQHIESGMVAFNGKCFNVIDDGTIFEYVVWRLQSNLRGYRKILTAGNEFCHGTVVKKEKYMDSRRSSRQSMKGRKGAKRSSQRERIRITSCCVPIESRATQYTEMLLSKFWSPELLRKSQLLGGNAMSDAVGDGPDGDQTTKMDEEREYQTMIIHKGDGDDHGNDGKTTSKQRRSVDENEEMMEYQTMLIHDDVRTQRGVHGPVPPTKSNLKCKSKSKARDRKSSKPTKATKSGTSTPSRKETSTGNSPSYSRYGTGSERRGKVKAPFTANTTYPKRKSLPKPNTGTVSSIAASFERETRRQTDPTFANMEAYDGPIYDTMVVHYDKENSNVPEMVQKAKSAHIMNSGLTKTMAAKQKRRRSVPKPAAENPNYQYNKTIDLERNKSTGSIQGDIGGLTIMASSPKPQSTKERIKFINDRLQQKMHQEM